MLRQGHGSVPFLHPETGLACHFSLTI